MRAERAEALRLPFAPMEALSVDEIPTGSGWLYWVFDARVAQAGNLLLPWLPQLFAHLYQFAIELGAAPSTLNYSPANKSSGITWERGNLPQIYPRADARDAGHSHGICWHQERQRHRGPLGLSQANWT
jgi:hypothetical protein